MTLAVLDIDPPDNGRLYAIGDVHGCFNELLALESKIRRSIKRTGFKAFKIISVGDLCDRGPDTKSVIEHFVQGKQASTHEFILGNHEMFFLMAFAGLRPDLLEKAEISLAWFHKVFARIYRDVTRHVEIWRVNGGDAVFRSYSADINDVNTWERIPVSHLRFLFGAPLVVTTPKAIISHAILHEGDVEILRAFDGAQTMTPDRRVLDAVHRCLWERTLPESRIDPVRRHVSGHTPMELVRRQSQYAMLQIDTGAVYGRSLTALNLENFRVMSCPSGFHYRRRQDDLY